MVSLRGWWVLLHSSFLGGGREVEGLRAGIDMRRFHPGRVVLRVRRAGKSAVTKEGKWGDARVGSLRDRAAGLTPIKNAPWRWRIDGLRYMTRRRTGL